MNDFTAAPTHTATTLPQLHGDTEKWPAAAKVCARQVILVAKWDKTVTWSLPGYYVRSPGYEWRHAHLVIGGRHWWRWPFRQLTTTVMWFSLAYSVYCFAVVNIFSSSSTYRQITINQASVTSWRWSGDCDVIVTWYPSSPSLLSIWGNSSASSRRVLRQQRRVFAVTCDRCKQSLPPEFTHYISVRPSVRLSLSLSLCVCVWCTHKPQNTVHYFQFLG